MSSLHRVALEEARAEPERVGSPSRRGRPVADGHGDEGALERASVDPAPRSAMQLAPLPRIAPPSLADFRRELLRPRRPVVLAGAAAGWPALERWSDAHLSDALGHLEVRAYVMPRGHIRIDPRTGFQIRALSLSAFIERLGRDDPDQLFLRTPLDARFDPVASDAPSLPYCARGGGLRRNLWMSGRGLVTQLHFDLPDNLVVMVRGRKRFVVLAPSERRHLDPYPWLSSVPHVARADPDDPDPSPSVRRARGWECVLEPGDALYLPPRFWHHARALEPSVSVNHWWCRPATRVLRFASDTYKRVRGLEI